MLAVGEGTGDCATGFADVVGMLDDWATGVVLEGEPQAPITIKVAIAEAILNVNMAVSPNGLRRLARLPSLPTTGTALLQFGYSREPTNSSSSTYS